MMACPKCGGEGRVDPDESWYGWMNYCTACGFMAYADEWDEIARQTDEKVREIMLCRDTGLLRERRKGMAICLRCSSGYKIPNITRWIGAIDNRLRKLEGA